MANNSDRSIVLTGATGFLGAFLMAGLLERGYRVTVLGRSSNGRSLVERVSSLTRWFGIHADNRLSCVEADFSKKHLGLDDHIYGSLCAHTGKLIHCASDTSFLERNRARVMEMNVKSISALLEFAEDAAVEKFYYISSAYASGIRDGICLESPVTGGSFTNVYEESKAMAENSVISACERTGIPLCILRPSIVFGHSGTGMALKFNALYYAVKSLLVIRDIFIKDILEQGGVRAGQWGFRLESDGMLRMPLGIRLKTMGIVNLVPVDYFVEAAMRIIEEPGSFGIYHITSDNPPEITALMEYAERFLHIRGIRLVLGSLARNSELNPAEELFNKFMEQYRPYLADTRSFDRSRIDRITGGLAVPPFHYEVFRRCMNYAVQNNWGRINGFPC
ncbi:MAG TPA: SDR family oxidoreductase [Clostridia bacterium]|nr:SDR family oxidoreductase [Clostridia bacterium]